MSASRAALATSTVIVDARRDVGQHERGGVAEVRGVVRRDAADVHPRPSDDGQRLPRDLQHHWRRARRAARRSCVMRTPPGIATRPGSAAVAS